MKIITKAPLCVLGMFVLATPALGQQSQSTPMLDQGTKELSVAGRIEFPDFDKVNYDIDTSYGYFFRDGWETGVRVGAADFGGVDRLSFSGFTEYNFNRNQNWVPYIGAGLGLASVEFNRGIDASTDLDDDGWVFDMETGIKWFVRPYMAITTSIDFQVATDDIFATGDAVADNLTSLRLGMRFYF